MSVAAAGDSVVWETSSEVTDDWDTVLLPAADCLPLASTSSEPTQHNMKQESLVLNMSAGLELTYILAYKSTP